MTDSIERPHPPQTGTEAEVLLGFLGYLRSAIQVKASGLDTTGLDTPLAPSPMTLGGMLKHLAFVEDWWFGVVFTGRDPHPPFADVDWDADADWDWHSAAGAGPDELIGLWKEFVQRSDAIVQEALAKPEGLEALSERTSHGSPVSMRWILVHMIEEYGRHAGHADLIRESIDGHTGE